MRLILQILLFFLLTTSLFAQPGQASQWTKDGNGYYTVNEGNLLLVHLPDMREETIVDKELLRVADEEEPLSIRSLAFSEDGNKVLIFTNAQRVWRYLTRGDYWVLDLNTNILQQMGKERPAASLMFAKFSPDGKQVAYVSERNIYVENVATGKSRRLTESRADGKLINGTFDWAYEEEFSCRDGFRWSPDGQYIAYWQIDAATIRDFYMINNTDSIYAFTIPVEYPKVGESPSACRLGVIDMNSDKTTWMEVPGDPQQHYIPRMEWAANGQDVLLQQLNRKQNHSKLFYANARSGKVRLLFEEQDEAWVDVRTTWPDSEVAWHWLADGKSLLWISEKDGWRHIYQLSADGKKVKEITPGAYDVVSPLAVDEADGWLYFIASPDNATQRYLYRSRLNGKGQAERLTPEVQEGSHSYTLSPNGKFAYHNFSNHYTRPMQEWISLPEHTTLDESRSIAERFDPTAKEKSNITFITLTTDDGVELDAWIAKPDNFDPTKKYPLVCTVYAEPAGQTTNDRYGIGRNGLYDGNMAADGYIYCSFDNRGTPAPKGSAWRKAIYRKIGIINIRDQAMALRKLIETHDYIDTERLAVHGWSGGGSTTLNLLFQYPDLYQTGIAVAAVANQLSYDNIYQERYMGVPQENLEDFIQGSPLTHAKNLVGNLLYIHGTGDDNVHYQNAEMLVNELIKHNRQFQFMPYPNRSHGIRSGEGTRQHLRTLFTNFLRQHCPPGAR